MPPLYEPTTAAIRASLIEWKDVSLSYNPMSLRQGGFIADEHKVLLGTGAEVFKAAADKLDRWEMFPEWARVHRLREGQRPGDVVAMVTRICGFWWVNPCRILRRCDTDTTHGFDYGTLPQHAECGEERFSIETHADGSVWYVIRAFSRPGHFLAWLAFPLARWWQCRFVRDSQWRMLAKPE
jgi:uncharacterized protein (UPF0548 family)